VTIPNIITLVRLVAVPVVVLLIMEGAFGWAFALFVAAGVSDAIDGTIARHVPGQASELGRYLDPIADKALLVSIYVTLGITGQIPAWLVLLVASRDALIVGGVLLAWVVSRPVPIVPLMVSKANTAAQILFAAVVLADLGLGWRLDILIVVLVWVVSALTIASAAAYLIGWARHMTGPGQETGL
jgi:cardiolipin synthase